MWGRARRGCGGTRASRPAMGTCQAGMADANRKRFVDVRVPYRFWMVRGRPRPLSTRPNCHAVASGEALCRSCPDGLPNADEPRSRS